MDKVITDLNMKNYDNKYDRKSEVIFIPVGIKSSAELVKRFEIDLDVGIDLGFGWSDDVGEDLELVGGGLGTCWGWTWDLLGVTASVPVPSRLFTRHDNIIYQMKAQKRTYM